MTIIRNDDLRKDSTSMGIVDSQSVQNTSSAQSRGYDAGKKTSGIKRHVVVDTLGLPHALHVTTADVGDRGGAVDMIIRYQDVFDGVEKFLVDAGYTGENFAEAVEWLTGAVVEVVKRSELHKFAVLPMRWIVERSFGWIEHCRRLWKNCERFLRNSKQMLVLAFISILLKRF